MPPVHHVQPATAHTDVLPRLRFTNAASEYNLAAEPSRRHALPPFTSHAAADVVPPSESIAWLTRRLPDAIVLGLRMPGTMSVYELKVCRNAQTTTLIAQNA